MPMAEGEADTGLEAKTAALGAARERGLVPLDGSWRPVSEEPEAFLELVFGCDCADPGCPVNHNGRPTCGHPSSRTLHRIDMGRITAEEPAEALHMCSLCADDALESGVFAEFEVDN
jgi:hypothetical protein